MLKNSWTLLMAAFVLAESTAHGEDWPEFRGPTGQGISKGRDLPVEWSDGSNGASKNIDWKTPIAGEGWSSPVLRDGRIYLTTAAPQAGSAKRSLRVICLEAASGKNVWNVEAFAPDSSTPIHSKNSHASPTPLIEGDRLFVHFGHQGAACLDLTGKIVWRNNRLAYPPVHGGGGSPILAGDALVFSCDGASDPFVVALDKSNGKVLWKVNRESDAKKKFSFSTPLLITVKGQPQVISPGSNVVCAYDPQTGREIWRVRYEGYSVVPRPVFGHGLVYISTSFDRPTVMAIRPDGTGDVTATHVAWTNAKGAPNTPSLLLVGDELYMLSDAGIASCLDAKTGKAHWQERIGGNCSASPVYADGRIYFQNEEGLGVVIEAGKEFRKLAGNPLNERTLASYAVGDGALFIRSEKHLYRVQKR
jgi:outer membrane protein assembly factor BamB